MSVLDEIRQKYSKQEKVADGYGRILTVQKLNPAQRLALLEMTDSQREDVIVQLVLAASVRFIDDIAIPFPRSRSELNSTMGALDEAGLQAVIEAYSRFSGGKSQEELADEAKKSRATATSELG
jgi:hypothetical protein